MKDKDAWHSIVISFFWQRKHISLATDDVMACFHIHWPAKQQQEAHTARSSSKVLACDGMKLHQQRHALLKFKEAEGMAVLVSSAAAQEGWAIVSYELVVSYTMIETGREMIRLARH